MNTIIHMSLALWNSLFLGYDPLVDAILQFKDKGRLQLSVLLPQKHNMHCYLVLHLSADKSCPVEANFNQCSALSRGEYSESDLEGTDGPEI